MIFQLDSVWVYQILRFFFQRSDSQSYIRAQWDKDEGNLGCLDRIPNPTFPRKMPYFSSNITTSHIFMLNCPSQTPAFQPPAIASSLRQPASFCSRSGNDLGSVVNCFGTFDLYISQKVMVESRLKTKFRKGMAI